MDVLRLGTRGSKLARMQSRQVADALVAANPGVTVELVVITTTGDRITDRPLHDIGGKGLFTKELQLALLDGRIDFAVHSLKDVPITQPLVDDSPLMIAATPTREDPADVLVRRSPADVEPRRIGTGSLRRTVLCQTRWPDAEIVGLRGNIDTRLAKLAAGEFDAIVLAAAGLRRAGLWDAARMQPLPTEIFVPSPGQGALALECRRDSTAVRRRLGAIDDPAARTCTTAEREVVRLLNGDCRSPIGAFATLRGGTLTLRVAVGGEGGTLPIRRSVANGTDPMIVAKQAVETLSDDRESLTSV